MSDSTENTNELDSYGVWVKNPQEENAAPSPSDEIEEVNFSDTLDLPDFDETSVPDDDGLNIFDDTPSLENTLDPSSEDTTLNTDELMNITNGVDIIETDESETITDTNDTDLSFDLNSGDDVQLDDNLNLDDVQLDDNLDLGDTEPVLDETSVTDIPEEPVIPDSLDEPVFDENIVEEPVITEEPAAQATGIEDAALDTIPDESFSFDTAGDETVSTDDFNTDIASEDTSSQGEEELSLDDFMDGGFSDESVAAGNNGYEPGAEPAPSSGGEEVSLDDFLDGGFEADKQKEEEQIVDEKPLEMDISFDNSADTVQTEDNTSIDEDLDDDEDAIETAYKEEGIKTEDVSDSFDSGSDATVTSSSTESFDSEEVDLSDFGIDADAEETPVTQDISESKNVEQVVDYDLSVSNESTAAAPVVNEIRDADKVEEISEIEDLQPEHPASTAVDNSLLQQIVADLSSLKNEINSLKSNLSEMKEKGTDTLSFDDIGIEDTKDDGGFFGGDDGDDTIALSNDELNNIMTTADFNSVDESNTEISDDNAFASTGDIDVTENSEPVIEETAVDESETISDEENFGVSMEKDSLAEEFAQNVENETLEEPDLENITVEEDVTDESIIDEQLPDEISISKDEDMLVESSSTDYMDSLDSNAEGSSDPTISGNLSEEKSEETETFTDVFDTPAPEENNDIFDSVDDAPFVTEETKTEITESNLNYLTSEQASEESGAGDNNSELKKDIKSVLLYMDQLLENLPEEKIVEFAKSEEFTTYKKLFSELGLS